MRAHAGRLAAAVVAALLVAAPGAAVADDDGDHHDDHDLARDLYEHGDIRALADILRVIRKRVPGDVVAVDLIQGGDGWVYRLQIIADDGRRVFVDVDAYAATVIGDGDGDR